MNPVSLVKPQVTTTQPAKNPKKTNYVAKGAAIALGADLATRGVALGVGLKMVGKEGLKESFKSLLSEVGKGKTAALAAASLALSVGIGAGIGKLVENAKAKKEG